MCGHPLRGPEGRELTRLDLRYDEVRARQEFRFRRLVAWGSAAVAGIGLVLGLVHAAAVVGLPLLVIGHLVTVRLVLMREPSRCLRPARRLFARWFIRLGILWGGAVGYPTAVVPIVGAVLSAATFAALTWLVHRYLLWSLRRERMQLPIALWERIVLVVLVVLSLAVVVLGVVLAALVGWTGSRLVDLIRG